MKRNFDYTPTTGSTKLSIWLYDAGVDTNNAPSFEDYDQAIAAVLLARKKHLGINFTDIALVSGIKYQQVMRLLNGKRPIQFSELMALCSALDLPLQEAARLTGVRVANTSS